MTLEELMELANLQQQAEGRVKEAEIALEQAKNHLRNISEDLLPSAMTSLGLTELRLSSGDIIRVSREVNCSIPEATNQQAFDWLAENGFGGMVKTEVKVAFPAGERMHALLLAEEIASNHDVAADVKQYVHPQTLKAWAKEQMQAGENLPNCFSVYPFNKTKITKR